MDKFFYLIRNAFMICTVLFLFGVNGSFPQAKKEKIAPNTQAIEEINQGKKNIAYASWWGFDPEDATEALQSAIDSGVQKVIVDNTGKPWVIGKTIHLRSNQEIIFEKGVIVEAKKGAFSGKYDCLFLAESQSNIVLNGYGATLKMRKMDYTKPPYEKAEWRHILALKSSENVKVYGLTLSSSGGDGVYIGVSRKGVPCKNIHIKDVICIDNYRQGISVISADNLIIENVILQDTEGTLPMAGIDFEPNEPSEMLSNIIMRNCISQNNAGFGFAFYLNYLNNISHPVSIRIEKCKAIGNKAGVWISSGNSKDAAVKGSIEFVDCVFENSDQPGIVISDKYPENLKVRFVDCKISKTSVKQPEQAPIFFVCSRNSSEPVGGVDFINCEINDEIERIPFAFSDYSGGRVKLKDITGTIKVVRNNFQKEYRITQELLSQWIPSQISKQFADFNLENLNKLEPLFPDAKFPAGISSNIRFRGAAEFLIWAKKGEIVSYIMEVQPVTTGAQPLDLMIITPSGKSFGKRNLLGENKNEFIADETGVYRIVCKADYSVAITMKSCTHRFCFFAADKAFHFFLTTGELYFLVPRGIKEFGINVYGDAGEAVKAIVYDEKKQILGQKDNIIKAHQFVVARDSFDKEEIYSISFERPSSGHFEDFYVRLQGIPALFVPVKEALLKLVEN
ncbi:MAG: right-handed parallel beta-helix repeat-containing protein [Candidatus Omnitrophica bacterium]|nr:right-handed parallel beta-helix repeat-containing protein [Candidatus Omnitrophota bacterium]